MTKLTGPLFSLGASGSIDQTLTYRTQKGQNVALKIPSHADPATLPQFYQRQTYRNGCFWWGSLSAPEKAAYRATGITHHRTAFQEAMAFYLPNQPDIEGWWRLDQIISGRMIDSGPNDSKLNLLGGTLQRGMVDRELRFSGAPGGCHSNTSALNLQGDYSIIWWMDYQGIWSDGAEHWIIGIRGGWNNMISLVKLADNTLKLTHTGAGASVSASAHGSALTVGRQLWGITKQGTTITAWIGNLGSMSAAGATNTNALCNEVGLGYSLTGANYAQMDIDDVRIYNRAISSDQFEWLINHNKY